MQITLETPAGTRLIDLRTGRRATLVTAESVKRRYRDAVGGDLYLTLRWDGAQSDTSGTVDGLAVLEEGDTTLRETALALAGDHPGTTVEENLTALAEVAEELGLSGDPHAPLSGVDADTVLADYVRQFADVEEDYSDAAYDRVVEASLWT